MIRRVSVRLTGELFIDLRSWGLGVVVIVDRELTIHIGIGPIQLSLIAAR